MKQMKHEFKINEHVLITKVLKGSQTEKYYSLDDEGKMLNMQGKAHILKEIYEEKLAIYSKEAGKNFYFHIDDISRYSKPKPQQDFTFDPQCLVI